MTARPPSKRRALNAAPLMALAAHGPTLPMAAARAGYLAAKAVLDRLAAVVLGALGLRLLFGR